MPYVDGFLLPVPKENLPAYRRVAQKAGKIWKEHGALEFLECVADDVQPGKLTSFPQSVKLKPDETVVFSWIMFKSRAHRDRVNAKVMKDPRMADMMDPKAMRPTGAPADEGRYARGQPSEEEEDFLGAVQGHHGPEQDPREAQDPGRLRLQPIKHGRLSLAGKLDVPRVEYSTGARQRPFSKIYGPCRTRHPSFVVVSGARTRCPIPKEMLHDDFR